MECSSCGAPIDSGLEQCGDCVAGTHVKSAEISGRNVESSAKSQGSKLIEFPGVTRSTVPQWRKELSERVREVQEKRAREEALELSVETREPTEAAPQLELLPTAEAPAVNPLVAAALRRIERAHEAEAYHAARYSNAAAVAYAEPIVQPELCIEEPVTLELEEVVPNEPASQIEKSHNLVIVPPPVIAETEPTPKPKRMIGDINDPALNYLDSVRTNIRYETTAHKPASLFARLVSAFVDLIVVGLLCFPFAAALELTNADWQKPRVWIVAAAIFSIVGFLYFTVSTALTGRTLGLKLLSLRIVDARTGLIPTGTQAAGRALIYLASLLILGITSVFALLNPERLTAHDRITRTAVVNG